LAEKSIDRKPAPIEVIISRFHDHFNRTQLSIDAFFQPIKAFKIEKRKRLAGKSLDKKPVPIEMIV